MELNLGLKAASRVCELCVSQVQVRPTWHTTARWWSNRSRTKLNHERHIMFFKTLTWQQITDLFTKVKNKKTYKKKKHKNSLSWQWGVQVVYCSWTVPFSLNFRVCKQKNGLEIKAQSVWSSRWLSQWHKAQMSTAVHLYQTVMMKRLQFKTKPHASF